jgi:[acyl-carrier-protein] S-malonyltransferase
MIADGATLFTEVGPGKVLAGLISKIDREAATANA